MHASILPLLLSALVLTEAAPNPTYSFHSRQALPRQVLRHPRPNSNISFASISLKSAYPASRGAGVSARKEGYQYSPSLIGEAAFFPSGPLGDARKASDLALWDVDRKLIESDIVQDIGAVKAAIAAHNGTFKSLDDYISVLYTKKWNETIPAHQAPGILSNYTQDLLFSMERLTQNPYPVELVKKTDAIPFEVDAAIVKNLTGTTLGELKNKGSLFVVDRMSLLFPIPLFAHLTEPLDQYQSNYTLTTDKFGAFCTALFFIHPRSRDFLPLAIKTNVGADLVYTPVDTANDWLLAKMMFNVNDMFHAEMFHLVATHDVGEAVHQAALRTLSEEHPVMILLERFMYQAYSARPVGEELCFNPGGHWDQNFLISEKGCRSFVTEFWPTAGRYQANYLLTDLSTRGLISNPHPNNPNPKHPFKSFPFLSDTLEIRNAFHTFFTGFVNSYYPTTHHIANDVELQNWFAEATSGAKALDFPQCGTGFNSTCTKSTLVDVLTHFAFINGVAHHSLNGGDPVSSKATLPFHLNGMYAPVPTTKNVTDLLPFLPPPANALAYIVFLATFNRPFYEEQNRTLAYAFEDQEMLAKLNTQTRMEAARYLAKMKKLGERIRAKSFDVEGLSEGMPFVWKAVDPLTIPYFFAV